MFSLQLYLSGMRKAAGVLNAAESEPTEALQNDGITSEAQIQTEQTQENTRGEGFFVVSLYNILVLVARL